MPRIMIFKSSNGDLRADIDFKNNVNRAEIVRQIRFMFANDLDGDLTVRTLSRDDINTVTAIKDLNQVTQLQAGNLVGIDPVAWRTRRNAEYPNYGSGP